MHHYIFDNEGIWLRLSSVGTCFIPEDDDLKAFAFTDIAQERFVTHVDGEKVHAVFMKEAIDTDIHGFVRYGLRESWYHLPQREYDLAGKCSELLYWDRNNRFCSICGNPMQPSTEISLKCTGCGNEIWPLLATAVITLIRRGDEVLLVRGRNFRRKFYGLVAGFVETGETLEEAVKREIMEETGLSVTNIRYFGSQPWPYPCGLMVGFTADYAGGEIRIQEEEIARAAWFKKDNMPEIPEKLSIARRLIDAWLESSEQEH